MQSAVNARNGTRSGGACYVNLGQGPRAVYAAVLRGSYVDDEAAVRREVRGRMVRLGSYGDPAAVPLEVWTQLLRGAAGHTGYTHQWRDPRFRGFAALVMASADNPAERDEARAAGWRTFAIRLAGEPLAHRESICPASPEGGDKLTCAACGACDGAARGRRGSVAIVVHGSLASRYRAARAKNVSTNA